MLAKDNPSDRHRCAKQQLNGRKENKSPEGWMEIIIIIVYLSHCVLNYGKKM